jgi:hypothetical protein
MQNLVIVGLMLTWVGSFCKPSRDMMDLKSASRGNGLY